MRTVLALIQTAMIAQFAVAKPMATIVPAMPATYLEAALHPGSVQSVPAPIVASGLPVPRWVTVKAPRVNVRRGPSLEREILWTYIKPGAPLEVIAEYDTWRRVRDRDGATGWVKSAMLDGRRNVIVTGRVNTALLSAPKADSKAVAYAAPGLMAKLLACKGEWCEISTRGYEGYVSRDRLWGVYENEIVKQ